MIVSGRHRHIHHRNSHYRPVFATSQRAEARSADCSAWCTFSFVLFDCDADGLGGQDHAMAVSCLGISF